MRKGSSPTCIHRETSDFKQNETEGETEGKNEMIIRQRGPKRAACKIVSSETSLCVINKSQQQHHDGTKEEAVDKKTAREGS